MKQLILHPTSLAQWHAIVNEAEDLFGCKLDSDLESYLVFLLQRYSDKPELVTSILAADYLQSLQLHGQLRIEKLQIVGDVCLLFSGLFPGRASKRHVTVSYFVELGQRAYNYLSLLQQQRLLTSRLYASLQKHFVKLMDLLFSLRELGGEKQSLTLMQAEDLWRNTGSQYALKILRKHNKNIIALKDVCLKKIH
jgi:hypothetical protein